MTAGKQIRCGKEPRAQARPPPKFTAQGVVPAILVAGPAISRRLSRMGAKYLPTIKDLKASRRFHEKQNPLPFIKKPSGAKHPKKSKKS
jgi:hypothetical protein